ncbi:MAG TPA: hypothetical protein VMF09_04510 [Solirubrobacteraceae bacterium]|nr:hypothetical protein [Solirubrobacteraceae bacterium]
MDGEPEDGDEQDWRMQAELASEDAGGAVRELVGRLRGPDVVKEIEATVPRDVVITHDGKLLFAYAADQATLAAARRAVETVLAREHIAASVRVSHWDQELDEWVQTDPPPSAEQRVAAEAARRAADAIETRTLVASSGRLVRAEFEQTMRDWADKLGLQCEIIEHPHLLSTQVAFHVTGPRRKLDEFARGLRAEELATIRTETAVMTSPL